MATGNIGNSLGGAYVNIEESLGGAYVNIEESLGGAYVNIGDSLGGAYVNIGNGMGGAYVRNSGRCLKKAFETQGLIAGIISLPIRNIGTRLSDLMCLTSCHSQIGTIGRSPSQVILGTTIGSRHHAVWSCVSLPHLYFNLGGNRDLTVGVNYVGPMMPTEYPCFGTHTTLLYLLVQTRVLIADVESRSCRVDHQEIGVHVGHFYQVEVSGEKMSSRKKTPFQKHREEEEAKKKRAEDETARLYQEFVESFQADNTPGSKAFVRGGTINPNDKLKIDSEGSDKSPGSPSSISSSSRRVGPFFALQFLTFWSIRGLVDCLDRKKVPPKLKGGSGFAGRQDVRSEVELVRTCDDVVPVCFSTELSVMKRKPVMALLSKILVISGCIDIENQVTEVQKEGPMEIEACDLSRLHTFPMQQ
ncbi:hypothetical protein FXO37_24973 [Capsicum annuum]|nr:hypothetical protein FXO37_24973 [Capsicum annuum]